MRSYRDIRRLIINGINRISISFGIAMSFLVGIVALLITIEVVRRYAFDSPTTWSLEMVGLLTGATFTLTAAYTLYQKGHVSVDILYSRLGPRKRAIIEMVSLVLFATFVITLLVSGWDFTWTALVQGQTTTSHWKAIIWPAKLVIPVGAFLLLLQGVAKFWPDIELLIKGKVEE